MPPPTPPSCCASQPGSAKATVLIQACALPVLPSSVPCPVPFLSLQVQSQPRAALSPTSGLCRQGWACKCLVQLKSPVSGVPLHAGRSGSRGSEFKPHVLPTSLRNRATQTCEPLTLSPQSGARVAVVLTSSSSSPSSLLFSCAHIVYTTKSCYHF